MKILVTGGLGYIGQLVLEKLDQANHEVIAVDANWYNIDSKYNVNIESLWKGNIISYIEKFKPDVLIHLSGVVGEPASRENPEQTFHENYILTKELMDVCNQYKIRFIFASSCSVYGHQENVLTEESDTMPLGLYALTKELNEKEIVQTLDDYCILRFGTVYGNAPRQRFDLVINKFTALATHNQPIQVYGGKQERPFTSVNDIARAIVWSTNQNLQGIYNVADKNFNMKQAAEQIVDTIGGDINIVETKEDNRSYEVSSEKLINTGFSFNSKFDEEIKKLSSWVKNNDWTDERYYNTGWMK